MPSEAGPSGPPPVGGELVRAGGPRRVVVAFPLSRKARARLVDRLGSGTELVDIRKADGTEEVVIVPSVSRQLVGRVRSQFPASRVLVVEVTDDEHGVDLGGPVGRALAAGADAYGVAGSLDELAALVGADEPAESAERELAALTAASPRLEAFLEAALRERHEARAEDPDA